MEPVIMKVGVCRQVVVESQLDGVTWVHDKNRTWNPAVVVVQKGAAPGQSYPALLCRESSTQQTVGAHVPRAVKNSSLERPCKPLAAADNGEARHTQRLSHKLTPVHVDFLLNEMLLISPVLAQSPRRLGCVMEAFFPNNAAPSMGSASPASARKAPLRPPRQNPRLAFEPPVARQIRAGFHWARVLFRP